MANEKVASKKIARAKVRKMRKVRADLHYHTRCARTLERYIATFLGEGMKDGQRMENAVVVFGQTNRVCAHKESLPNFGPNMK